VRHFRYVRVLALGSCHRYRRLDLSVEGTGRKKKTISVRTTGSANSSTTCSCHREESGTFNPSEWLAEGEGLRRRIMESSQIDVRFVEDEDFVCCSWPDEVTDL